MQRKRSALPKMLVLAGLICVVLLLATGKRRPDGSDARRSNAIAPSAAAETTQKAEMPPPPQPHLERMDIEEVYFRTFQQKVKEMQNNNLYPKDSAALAEAIGDLARLSLRSEPAYKYLTESLLKSGDARTREVALLALGSMRHKRAVGAIAERLKNDEDAQVRLTAAYSLAIAGNETKRGEVEIVDLGMKIAVGVPAAPDSVYFLARCAAEEPIEKIRGGALQMLAYASAGGLIPEEILLSLAENAKAPVQSRANVLALLPARPSAEAIQRISSLAKDAQQQEAVRSQALIFLSRVDVSPECAEGLSVLLQDRNASASLRLLAARLLYRFRTEGVVAAFKAMLEEESLDKELKRLSERYLKEVSKA
jgi:HEAT repeat protein